MNNRWLAAATFAGSLLAVAASARAADDVTLFRVFLRDGTALVSYGEPARVDDRIVFSMPTAATADPPLHLVTIPADRVDWDRTNRYAESARGAHYVATRGEGDYAALTNEVANTLNQVANTADPAARLSIAEAARKALAGWPAQHYNYRDNDVRQMLMLLDEAIAGLRSAAGGQRFDLSFVAYADGSAPAEPLLPPPTPREAIEQTLRAARLVDSPAERTSLLSAVVATLDGSRDVLPSEWAGTTRAAAVTEIESELTADRAYRALSAEIMKDAQARARMADVRGLARISAAVHQRDAALGQRRPEAINALLAAVDAQLDAARRLQLARDRWAMRVPELRRYREAMRAPMVMFAAMRPQLDNIKSLAGSSVGALWTIRHTSADILAATRGIVPPNELKAAHSLLVSAAAMASNAASIRREATLSGDVARAWDASAAASGAMMLADKAREEILSILRRPELE